MSTLCSGTHSLGLIVGVFGEQIPGEKKELIGLDAADSSPEVPGYSVLSSVLGMDESACAGEAITCFV